jgi:hypothetical protein
MYICLDTYVFAQRRESLECWGGKTSERLWQGSSGPGTVKRAHVLNECDLGCRLPGRSWRFDYG